ARGRGRSGPPSGRGTARRPPRGPGRSRGRRTRGEHMNVHVESVFDCPPDRAWDEVQQTALLLEVCGPLVTFRAVEPAALPPRWEEGMTVRCRSYLFGVVPLGTRTVRIERIDQEARAIQTREQDPLFRRG